MRKRCMHWMEEEPEGKSQTGHHRQIAPDERLTISSSQEDEGRTLSLMGVIERGDQDITNSSLRSRGPFPILLGWPTASLHDRRRRGGFLGYWLQRVREGGC